MTVNCIRATEMQLTCKNVHRAVSAEAAEAWAQDGAADSCSNATSHVHDAGAGVVNGAGAEQQLAVGAAVYQAYVLSQPARS